MKHTFRFESEAIAFLLKMQEEGHRCSFFGDYDEFVVTIHD